MSKCISCGDQLPPLNGSEENDFRSECEECEIELENSEDDFEEDNEDYSEVKNNNCTGLKFRGRSQNYFNEKKMAFEHKESLTLLKRESCKCPECKEAIESLKQSGGDLLDCIHWSKFVATDVDKEVEDGETYKGRVEWDCEEGYGCYVEEIYFSRVK